MSLIFKLIPNKIREMIKNKIGISPTKELDLSKLVFVRDSPNGDLIDKEILTKIICELGLNDEELFNYPKFLYPFCGKGLLSWQYPNQFSEYLIKLSSLKIKSYLEIGVKHGGTLILTVEYLNRFSLIEKAIGIDLFPVRGLKEYRKINKNIKSLVLNSRSKEFKKLLVKEGPFDLTLIDGDHSYEGCLSDFESVMSYSNIIVFHDIVGSGVPGVRKLWNEIKHKHLVEFEFYEFIEQYEEVIKNTGQTWLGIGMAIKKNKLWI